VDVQLKVFNSIEDFHGLKKQWNELYIESAEATIFLSWDWMYTWWEVFNKSFSSQLFILGVYENGKLFGLAPFHIMESSSKSFIQGKTIMFLGFGEKRKDVIVSQYLDFLVKPDKKKEMVNLVSSFLLESKDRWDFADFPFLLENSVVSNCFKENGLKVYSNYMQYGHRFYISEVNDFDDFLKKIGNRWSKMYEKKYRKLQKQGKVKIESSDNVETAKDAFNQLAMMHTVRWKDRTEINIFNSELFNEFHLKILERLVPQNKAVIKSLTLEQKPLSSYYYFKDKSQIHYYQSGFYTENANKYSPLFLLVCKEIGSALKSNSIFDFMFDENESSYKKEQYGAVSQPMYRLIWSPYKSRMIRYDFAKALQTKFLCIRSSIFKSKNKL